jgi:hypothetical protein
MGSWWGIAYPKKKGYTKGDSRVPLRVPLFFRRNDWTRGDNTKKKGCWLAADVYPAECPIEIGEIRFPIRPPQIFERKCIIHIKVEQDCPKNLGWTAGVKSDIGSDTNLVWVGRWWPSSTPFFGSSAPFLAWPPPGPVSPSESPTGSDVRRTGTPFFASPPSHHHTPVGKGTPPGPPLPFCPFGLLQRVVLKSCVRHHPLSTRCRRVVSKYPRTLFFRQAGGGGWGCPPSDPPQKKGVLGVPRRVPLRVPRRVPLRVPRRVPHAPGRRACVSAYRIPRWVPLWGMLYPSWSPCSRLT